jgi:membrane-bound inhibitor of C-type lysozyme
MGNDAFNIFIKLCEENDVDKELLKNPSLAKIVNNLECFGNNFGEQAEAWIKNVGKKGDRIPNPAQALPPSQAVINYLEPNTPTTLYNVFVNNGRDRKPFFTKTSEFFSGLSYGIRNWDVEADKQLSKNKDLAFVMGEHAGIKYKVRKDESSNAELSLLHNNRNGKNELEYYTENPLSMTSVSVFNQKENIGASFSYYNKIRKLSFSASADKYSSSMRVNWHPSDNVELGGYTNYNYKDKVNNCIGVHGRLDL